MICFLRIDILGRFWPEIDQQWRPLKLFHIEGHLLRCPSCKCHKRWSQRPSFYTSSGKISQKDIERSILDYSVSRLSRVPHFFKLSFTYLRLGAICYFPKKKFRFSIEGGRPAADMNEQEIRKSARSNSQVGICDAIMVIEAWKEKESMMKHIYQFHLQLMEDILLSVLLKLRT